MRTGRPTSGRCTILLIRSLLFQVSMDFTGGNSSLGQILLNISWSIITLLHIVQSWGDQIHLTSRNYGTIVEQPYALNITEQHLKQIIIPSDYPNFELEYFA